MLNIFLIQNALRKYAANELYSDVVFIVENKKKEFEQIPAHRMLLGARSPVFEAMLYPNPELEQTKIPKTIYIKDTPAEIFKLMLEAIYTDQPRILAHQVVDSVACARKYQVATFFAACQNYLSRGLSYDNACELLISAAPDDQKFVIRFIEENCEEVVQQDPNFTKLSAVHILSLVRSNKLCVSEIELFKAIMRWGEAECKRKDVDITTKNLQGLLEKILGHIRFPLMSTNELAMIVSPTGILDPDDLIAVFTYCSSQQVNVGTVGGFCTHPRQSTFRGGSRMKFDAKKSCPSVIISSDGMSVSPKDKNCGAGKMAMTNVPYPKFGTHYFEILIDHERGCNDAIGVVHKQIEIGSRLGENKTSWGVRVHGPSANNQQYGAVHVSHKDFFKDWQKNDRVGVKFDARKKTLSYYRNGKFLGTPFTDVEGEIYPCVEICHGGSLVANFKALAPRG